MTRISQPAIVAAFLLAGSAFGQSWSQAPPAESAAPSSPANGVVLGQPLPSGGPASFGPAPAGPPGDVWGGVDYLLGWVRGDRLPVLVTTSPAGTDRSAAGVLGQPGTRILFGGSSVNTAARSGARANLGYWFDPEHHLGIEAGGFFLTGNTTNFAASSDGTTILARPYTDVTTGNQASALLGFPGVSSGSVSATDRGRQMYSGNVDLRENVVARSWFRLDSLFGYRYLKYDERLEVRQRAQPTSGPFAAGTTLDSTDSYSARNVFNGLDVGVRAEFFFESASLELLAKVAGGSVSHTVDIAGSQQVTVPGTTPVTRTGGLLALGSNSGSHGSHDWTGVPELGVNLGWQVSPNLRVRLGYTALWLINAVRPGEQIDTALNPALFPPATAAVTSTSHPATLNHNSDLFVQALNLGLEVRY